MVYTNSNVFHIIWFPVACALARQFLTHYAPWGSTWLGGRLTITVSVWIVQVYVITQNILVFCLKHFWSIWKYFFTSTAQALNHGLQPVCVDSEQEEDPPFTGKMLSISEQKNLPTCKSFTQLAEISIMGLFSLSQFSRGRDSLLSDQSIGQ